MDEVHYFSNSTEFDCWRAQWCNRCDVDFETCHRVDSMYLGNPDPQLTGGEMGRWVCGDFSERSDGG